MTSFHSFSIFSFSFPTPFVSFFLVLFVPTCLFIPWTWFSQRSCPLKVKWCLYSVRTGLWAIGYWHNCCTFASWSRWIQESFVSLPRKRSNHTSRVHCAPSQDGYRRQLFSFEGHLVGGRSFQGGTCKSRAEPGKVIDYFGLLWDSANL